MVDYRNYTDDMFNRAMAMKNKDVDKIPTNYLYILYTKYKAEVEKILSRSPYIRQNAGPWSIWMVMHTRQNLVK